MKKLAFLTCAVLLTSMVMTSCKGDANAPEKQQDVVKTQFSISLPNQLKSGPNRMPGATVQKNGMTTFQGMKDITLVPFAKQGAILGTDTRLGDNITTASTPVAPMAVSKSDIESHPSQAKVFEDVTIPLTTGSFLFYAKSAASGKKFNVGSLIAKNLTNEPADFKFCLEQIQADASPLLTTGSGKLLLDYMSSVANATDGTKAWKAYTDADNQALHDMFTTYTSAHGVSSFEVARMMSDLYKSLIPAHSTIAEAIKTAIANPTYATVNTTTGVVTLQSGLLNFPQSYSLPEGSIDITWNGTAFVEGTYAGMAKPNTYVYPAQLWYYVNSTIKTSNQSRKTMYDDTNDWATILAAHTDAVSVNARTRAVAIENPIQYAVARLDVAVRLNASSLVDNSLTVEGAATNVDCSASGFPVTGVLVGGQQDAKWDFTTAGSIDVTGISAYTVYDSIIDPAIVAEYKAVGSYSNANSTLVLENGTSNVMIAVEMLNDKADFYGASNQLIPLGSKFYVVAELTASAATQTDGHVFKQDYTTTARLTLKDLKTAYNTIPDLRTPQLELGFSVDLTWQDGHVYDVDFQ